MQITAHDYRYWYRGWLWVSSHENLRFQPRQPAPYFSTSSSYYPTRSHSHENLKPRLVLKTRRRYNTARSLVFEFPQREFHFVHHEIHYNRTTSFVCSNCSHKDNSLTRLDAWQLCFVQKSLDFRAYTLLKLGVVARFPPPQAPFSSP